MSDVGGPDVNVRAVLERLADLKERFQTGGPGQSYVGRMFFPARDVPPPLLYKYTSVHVALIILRTMSLRYTQAEVLDDFFEETPTREQILAEIPGYEDGPFMAIDISDPEERLKMFERVIAARNTLRASGEILRDDVITLTTNGVGPDWKYELGNLPLKQAMTNFPKPLALSLTVSPVNSMMWGKYGDSHKGVVLAFKSRSPYFRSNRDLIGRSGFFGPVGYRVMSADDFSYRFPVERFFIKDPVWSYQEEWRRIEFADFDLGGEAGEDKIYTFPFPPEILDSVILGGRCPQKDKEEIEELLSSINEFRNVKMGYARRNLKDIVIDVGKH